VLAFETQPTDETIICEAQHNNEEVVSEPHCDDEMVMSEAQPSSEVVMSNSQQNNDVVISDLQPSSEVVFFWHTDVAYLRISKVSIYISSPQELVRYHGLFDIDYHFKLKE